MWIEKPLRGNSHADRFALGLVALAIICSHAAAQDIASDDWYKKGLDLDRNGNRQAAIEAFDKAVELNTSNSLAWHGKASNLFMIGRYEEANQAYDRALENADDEYFLAVLWIKKGDALENLKRKEQADSAFEKGIDIADGMITRYEIASDSENLSAAWLLKGKLLEWTKRFEDAIEAYDNVTRTDPQNVPQNIIAWNSIAFIQGTEMSRFDEAIEAYDRILDSDPKTEGALKGKAEALESMGRHEEAIKYYSEYLDAFKIDDRFLGLPPDTQRKRKATRAEVLLKLGRYRESLDICNEILRDEPTRYSALIFKGKALDALGRHQEAVEAYNEALKDFHLIEETRIRDAGPQIIKGNVLRALGRYEEALAAYDRALKLNGRYVGAWHCRGLALRDLGRDDEAEEAFARSIEMGYVG